MEAKKLCNKFTAIMILLVALYIHHGS